MQKSISTLIHLFPVFFLSSCLLLPHSVTLGEPLARFTVETGDYMRFGTPVSLDLTGVPVGFPTDKIRLIEIRDSKRILILSQLEPGSPPRLWWILLGKPQAGSKLTYEIERIKEQGPVLDVTYENAPYVQAEKNDSFLQIQTHGPSGIRKILRYHHAIVPAPQGQSKLYDRSAFIHPLWSPSGSVLTNIHPPDHYHHLGIWMPWTKTKFEGKEVDFWNLGKGEGTVRFNKLLSTSSGIIFGGFRAEHDHVALTERQAAGGCEPGGSRPENRNVMQAGHATITYRAAGGVSRAGGGKTAGRSARIGEVFALEQDDPVLRQCMGRQDLQPLAALPAVVGKETRGTGPRWAQHARGLAAGSRAGPPAV